MVTHINIHTYTQSFFKNMYTNAKKPMHTRMVTLPSIHTEKYKHTEKERERDTHTHTNTFGIFGELPCCELRP